MFGDPRMTAGIVAQSHNLDEVFEVWTLTSFICSSRFELLTKHTPEVFLLCSQIVYGHAIQLLGYWKVLVLFVIENFSQRHSGWMHTIPFSCTQLDLVPIPYENALLLAAAKTFAPIFLRVKDVEFSSFLGFVVQTCIVSCVSALSFNLSLKSMWVRRLRAFLTVCIDQVFMVGESFITAWRKSVLCASWYMVPR